MGLSIPEIARDERDFILNKLTSYEQSLHPSSAEDEELVRRATFTVRNRAVLFERFIPFSSVLYAVVQDVRSAEVTVDFKRDHIICSCPSKTICRHEVGVMLALYQYFGSVQEWKANWQAKKGVQLHTLANERSPESWQRLLDEVVDHALHSAKRMDDYMISPLTDSIRAKLQRHLPFEREWQPLFHIFMELATLTKLWSHFLTTGTLSGSYYFNYYIERALTKIQDYLMELSSDIRLFETDAFYDSLQTMIRELMLLKTDHVTERFHLYSKFWDRLFIRASYTEKELAALREQPDSPTIRAMQMLHFIRTNQKEALTGTMTNSSIADVEYLITLATFAKQSRKGELAEQLARQTLPFIGEFITQLEPMDRQFFIMYISKLFETISLTEQQALELYAAYGHYGVQPYSEYLLRNERYGEWVALHQLHPSSIAYLDSCGLKTVLANAPGLTLPLYHYYAMQEIAQKSRMNYKQAVRIWRSMKSAAKKSGNTVFWENYIDTVRQQYKRLRALQEEINKSNLLV
ncbi:MAG: hypothetical protein ABS949_14285 [Solibacillus sp.]